MTTVTDERVKGKHILDSMKVDFSKFKKPSEKEKKEDKVKSLESEVHDTKTTMILIDLQAKANARKLKKRTDAANIKADVAILFGVAAFITSLIIRRK